MSRCGIKEWLGHDDWDPNILPRPKLEYYGDSAGLKVSRDSNAIDFDFSEVARDSVRSEILCAATRPDIDIYFDQKRKVLAVTDSKILFTNLGGTKLYFTDTPTDPVAGVVEIIDISTDPNFSDRIEDAHIKSMRVLDDNSWLLCLGIHESLRSEGNLYRSEDEGQSWKKVLTYPFGYTNDWSWGTVTGNEILAVEYGSRFQYPEKPRDIYYSNDYGQTWSLAL